MAPVPLEAEVSYTKLAVVILHILGVIYGISTVGSSLSRSYRGLSPSQVVRSRLAKRRKLVPVFGALAILSMGIAGYSAATYGSLSYRVWADERGLQVPDRFFGGSPAGVPFGGTNATQIYVARWLNDTPVYHEAFEIIAEKARRFWWGQQIELSLVPWALILAVEGRRRRIPSLYAFISLAHLVNLSFAQNLFYVALLLTPAPLPEPVAQSSTRLTRIRDVVVPPKSPNWCLKPGLFLLVSIANYFTIFLLPYAAETPSFSKVVGLSRALSFAPLLLQSLAPVSWGTVHPHPHKVHSAFTDLFRFTSLISALLHGKATFVGLIFNVPDSHYHRHSNLLPWDIEKRTQWERTTTAVGKLLGSTNDHPVVAATGHDVLMCGLSLGLWAAVRALDAGDILMSAVPLYKGTPDTIVNGFVDSLKEATGVSSDNPESGEEESAPASPEGTVRRRLKQISSRVVSISSSIDPADDVGAPTPRRRGRPRKVKEAPVEEPGDETYQPSAAERVNATEGDTLPSEDLDWEAAALAWGLTGFGGLGCGSAGVFGGECLSR